MINYDVCSNNVNKYNTIMPCLLLLLLLAFNKFNDCVVHINIIMFKIKYSAQLQNV